MSALVQHPLSAAFPAMSREDLAALTDDIATHGLRQPVVVFEGQVLDGWHRYSACLAAGIEPTTVELPAGVDPVALVLSLNLSRRHLTASQRAAAVVACAEWRPVGSNQHKGACAPGAYPPPSAKEMAEKADVSLRTVVDAKLAHKAGLGDAVRDGKLSAKAAAAKAAPPKPSAPSPSKPDATELQDVDERMADMARDFEAMARIVEADDRLAAAWAEVRMVQDRYEQLEGLYQSQRVELATMTKEASRWMRKAQALEKQAKGGAK